MKAIRTRWVCGGLLAGLCLLAACATDPPKQVRYGRNGEERTEDTFWWDLLGWLAYPTAQANSERESKDLRH